MAFREKSAWAFLVLFTFAGAFYAWEVIGAGVMLGEIPPPSLKLALVYVGLIIIGAIVTQSSLALGAGEEADLPADERERAANDKAGNWSGVLLGVGVITGLVHFYAHQNGNVLFHVVVASLMISQIAEYALQIWLYRRGV